MFLSFSLFLFGMFLLPRRLINNQVSTEGLTLACHLSVLDYYLREYFASGESNGFLWNSFIEKTDNLMDQLLLLQSLISMQLHTFY